MSFLLFAAPVEIESRGPDGTQTVKFNDATFEIWCRASGSHVEKVTWKKDSVPLDGDGADGFVVSELEDVDGDFAHGQKKGWKSVLRRNIVGELSVCEDHVCVCVCVCAFITS